MAEFFISAIFGESRHPTENEKELLSKMAKEIPAALFQAINKELNKKDLCLMIDVLSDKVQPHNNGMHSDLA